MLPEQSPGRVVRAHQKLTPSLDFLAQYGQWLAGASDEHCDFALGNPQTMPLEGFVTALRAYRSGGRGYLQQSAMVFL